LLKTIKWEGAQVEDRSYNDNGLLTGVTRAFVDETRTCNAGSQLTQINNTKVGSQTYTYDQNGNVTSEMLSGNMANYSFSTIHAGGPFADGYDSEDRFMRFKRSGVTEDILLTRSNIGNISNVNRNGNNTARGYNTSHGLTTVTGGTTQTYDTDGNTTKLHTNVNAVWDDAGRMKNTNVPAGATAGIVGLNENGYVGGTRVWKKITRSGSVVEHRVHIHAGPNLIAEYNAGVAASTPVQEYVYAGEIDSLVLIRRSDATKCAVTRNRQWSITALHDLANGNIVERYAYEMTGKRTIYAANGTTVRTTSSYGNNFGYTNRWHDEDSGLMYFRARYYNPLTGEFLSRDPMEFVDGMSLYRGYFGLSNMDAPGTCKCSGQDFDLVADLIISVVDSEIHKHFKEFKNVNKRWTIVRLDPPRTKYREFLYWVVEKERYKIVCCLESDGSVTLTSITEIKQTETTRTGNTHVSKPWILNENNKEAYIKYIHPVPYWANGYAPGSGKEADCLELTKKGTLGGHRLISTNTPLDQIPGGEKEDTDSDNDKGTGGDQDDN